MSTHADKKQQQALAKRHIEAKRRVKRRRGHGTVHRHGDGERTGDDDDDHPVEREAFTIKEFCRAHRISEPLYFKMKKLGKGPREMHALGRIMISVEAAAEWRRANEVG
jgi:hypothetical protein